MINFNKFIQRYTVFTNLLLVFVILLFIPKLEMFIFPLSRYLVPTHTTNLNQVICTTVFTVLLPEVLATFILTSTNSANI